MRQLLLMIRMLTAVCAVCLTVLLNVQGDGAVSRHDSSIPVESAVMTPWQQSHHEATLTDATQLYRVCSSRPQRFVPTQGSGSGRTFSPCTASIYCQTTSIPSRRQNQVGDSPLLHVGLMRLLYHRAEAHHPLSIVLFLGTHTIIITLIN